MYTDKFHVGVSLWGSWVPKDYRTDLQEEKEGEGGGKDR